MCVIELCVASFHMGPFFSETAFGQPNTTICLRLLGFSAFEEPLRVVCIVCRNGAHSACEKNTNYWRKTGTYEDYLTVNCVLVGTLQSKLDVLMKLEA